MLRRTYHLLSVVLFYVAATLLLPHVAKAAATQVGSCASPGASCSISAGTSAVGDLFVAFAYRSGSTTAPTVPSGWTTVSLDGANSNSAVVACKVGTTTSETSGQWTNATDLVIVWYRGTAAQNTANCNTTGIGNWALGRGLSSSISYNGFTLRALGGTSGLLACAGHSAASSVSTPPPGMVNANSAGSGPMAACHSTTSGVTSWATQSVAVGTSGGWESYALEILAPCSGVCADVFIDMNIGSTNSALTTTMLQNGTIGTINGWELYPSGTKLFGVVPSRIARPADVTIKGVVYPPSHPSQAISYDNSKADLATVRVNLPTGHKATTTSGFVTVAPPNNGSLSRLFDYVVIFGFNGGYACMQLNNGEGHNPGRYAINIETDGSGTIHSQDIVVTPGATYWFSLKADFVNGVASLALFNPSDWSQVGTTVTIKMKTGQNVTQIRYGNNEVGIASTTSYFEDLLIDYTYAVFPLGPGVDSNTGVAAKGTVTDRVGGSALSGVKVLPCNQPGGCDALATTDASGRYRIQTTQLNGQTSGTLWFQRDAYFVNAVPYSLTDSPTILDTTLLPGGTLMQGRVTDSSTQAGIVGASVQLYSAGNVFGDTVKTQSIRGGQYSLDSSSFYEAAAQGFSIAGDASGFLNATAPAYVDYQSPGDQIATPFPFSRDIAMNPTGETRQVTIASSPDGVGVTVDGVSAIAPQIYQWVPGSEHTLVAPASQDVSDGVRNVFASWSNGGGASQTIAVPDSDVTYTAAFSAQYLLSTTVSPVGAGTITAGGWFNPGTGVSITATPSAGYQFDGFSGDLSGTTNPQTLLLNAPATVTATFSVAPVPHVASLAVNPAFVIAGSTSIGTVTLVDPAPGGGAVVALLSGNTAAATVPASVKVSAGAISATFTITSLPVTAASISDITATLNGSASAPLSVMPVQPLSLAVNPASVAGGLANATGTVVLNAPASGTTAQRTVTLASGDTTVATVPASVTVASGATSATFTITSKAVSAATPVMISALMNGGTQSATLTVVPPPGVASLTLNPTTVVGGTANATGTITMDAPAAGTTAQRTVTLTSSNSAAATVPTTVTVATGATSATFTVTSKTVPVESSFTISATLNGSTVSGTLTVKSLPGVASVTLNTVSVVGGIANATGTVVLEAPASGTSTQRTVTLTSSNTSAATVPASVAVSSGATSATFTVTSKAVSVEMLVTISATKNGVAQSAALIVTPPPKVTSLTLGTDTVVGGSATTLATVTLDSPAVGTSSQRSVTLTSSNTSAATVPSSVAVPAGATSATFTITSKIVSASAKVTITAKLNGSVTATLTVVPVQPLSLTLSPTTVVGGTANSVATLVLNGAASGTNSQRTITLTSSKTAAATVPSSVIVASGATSVTFTVTSKKVTASTDVTISSSKNGGTQTAVLTVTP